MSEPRRISLAREGGRRRVLACALALVLGAFLAADPVAQGAAAASEAAGGPQVPRFVSLKSDRVNVRGGPT